jgi:hypothetical protein
MEDLPGNRKVQKEFVLQYIKEWGDSIDRVNHPMSGLLLDLETTGADSSGFLPIDLRVQVCHGQHRKMVMEEKIRTCLIQETLYNTGEELDASHEFPKEDLHSHPDAYWEMNLYPACE